MDNFNIIYSSGTTGQPKGIIQSHSVRWMQISGFFDFFDENSVTIVSTPLYSNTTLSCLLPTLGAGGTIVLMRKFDALAFLELSERHKVQAAMLVPIQYRRLLQHPEFDRF